MAQALCYLILVQVLKYIHLNQMVDGGSDSATYEYGIEMLHRTKPHQRVIRKFSSDFEVGLAVWWRVAVYLMIKHDVNA